MRDLVSGPRRFVELQRTLPGISTEQLRSRLNRMVADGLLTRQRYREVPPRVDYELTDRARDLDPGPRRARALGLRVVVDRASSQRGDRRRCHLPARAGAPHAAAIAARHRGADGRRPLEGRRDQAVHAHRQARRGHARGARRAGGRRTGHRIGTRVDRRARARGRHERPRDPRRRASRDCGARRPDARLGARRRPSRETTRSRTRGDRAAYRLRGLLLVVSTRPPHLTFLRYAPASSIVRTRTFTSWSQSPSAKRGSDGIRRSS